MIMFRDRETGDNGFEVEDVMVLGEGITGRVAGGFGWLHWRPWTTGSSSRLCAKKRPAYILIGTPGHSPEQAGRASERPSARDSASGGGGAQSSRVTLIGRDV